MRYVYFALFLMFFTFFNLSFSQTPIDKTGRVFIDQPAKIRIFDSNAQQHKLTIVHDFEQIFTWISNTHFDTLFSSNVVYLPEDTYTILCKDFPSKSVVRMVAFENVKLTGDTTITVSKNMAIHTTEYSFTRENGDTLHMHGFGKYTLNSYTGLRLLTLCWKMDTTSVIWHYNHLPSYLNADWTVKGKPSPNNAWNMYLLNNKAIFPCKDTLITNDPVNLAYALLKYILPDSIPIGRRVQYAVFNPGFHAFTNDPRYGVPHDVEVFQDTSADVYTVGSQFYTELRAFGVPGVSIVTPELRVMRDKVYSYISPGEYDLPIPISLKNNVELGHPPTFFHGSFRNTKNEIKISGTYGFYHREQLFLSMTNDVLRHIPYLLTVQNDQNVIHSQNLFPLYDPYDIQFGFDPDDLKITVPTGKYSVTIEDTHSLVDGMPALTKVYFDFDLRQTDKNPPRMRSFQLWTEDSFNNNTARISPKLYKYNRNYLTFILDDSSGIGSVEMAIENFHTGEARPLPVQQNYPNYRVEFPDMEQGYYTISVKVSDPYGNNFTSVMKPAFNYIDANSIDEQKNIQPQKFTLYQNYPNPFNSSTTIRVDTKSLKNDELQITIFDIQGRLVRKLSEPKTKNRFREFIWNGKNEIGNSVSTGIYFGKFEGGEANGLIKMLYLR